MTAQLSNRALHVHIRGQRQGLNVHKPRGPRGERAPGPEPLSVVNVNISSLNVTELAEKVLKRTENKAKQIDKNNDNQKGRKNNPNDEKQMTRTRHLSAVCGNFVSLFGCLQLFVVIFLYIYGQQVSLINHFVSFN